MSEHTKRVKLSDVTLRITDGSHNPPKGIESSQYLMLSSKNISDGEINFNSPRYLSAFDFAQESKRTRVKRGDVLLTIVGTIGRCAVVETDEEFTLQRSVAVITPNQDLLTPRFLMYVLANSKDLMNEKAQGTAQKGLYLNQVRDFEIALPSLEEQLAITKKLDLAHTLIKSATENIRNIEIESAKLRNSIYESAYRDCPLSSFSDVIHVYQPETIPAKSLKPGGEFPVYGANGVIGSHDHYNHENAELLLGCRGSVGAVNVSQPKSWINGNAMVVRPVGAVLDLSFIKHGLLGGFSIQSAITGSAQPQITRTSLNGIVVPTPPMDRQLEIVRLLDNCQLTLENLSTSLSQMKTRFQELQNSILKEILGGSNA